MSWAVMLLESSVSCSWVERAIIKSRNVDEAILVQIPSWCPTLSGCYRIGKLARA